MYGVTMAATYACDENPRQGHPLLPGAAPSAIRANLLSEDLPRFDADYEQALASARESLDLTDLFKTLEQWRRIALLQSNPANFRQITRRAAELLTGNPSPEDEALVVTREKAGM
jgi:hypothetical protein